ncbi:MAG: cellulose biosynthesis cyclic di-GMP-binding regulatory protein BcsB [Ardenticatenaceae bacterium]
MKTISLAQSPENDTPQIERDEEENLWQVPLQLLGHGESVRLHGQVAQRDLYLPIPDGLDPHEFRAEGLISPDIRDGYLEVRSGERVLTTISLPTKDNEIVIPLDKVTVRQEEMALTFVVRLRSADDICLTAFTGAWFDLQSPMLVLAGDAAPPATVSEFLPSILTRVQIVLPENPSEAEADAALQIAATVTQRYAAERPIIEVLSLGEGVPSTPSPFERVVVIQEGGEDGMLLLEDETGWPYLRLQGSGIALRRQGGLLVNERSAVAVAPAVRVLDFSEPDQIASEQITLGELDVANLQVTGVGRLEIPIAFSQSELEGPVNTIDLRLAGTYTPPVTGAQAELSVLFNGALIHAEPLEGDGTFDIYLNVPNELVERDNELMARFDYTPAGGECKVGVQPFTGQLAEGSYLQVTRGQSIAPGFDRWPQVSFPSAVVGIEPLNQTMLKSAVNTVIFMQRITKNQLQWSVEPWSDALVAEKPTVLVTTDSQAVSTLEPPLTLEEQRIIDNNDQQVLQVDLNMPLAVIQAFEKEGRDILLLLQQGENQLLPDLTATLVNDDLGLYDIQGDVVLKSDASSSIVDLRLRSETYRIEPLAPTASVWVTRYQPLFYLIALVAVLLVMAWVYPRVVRRGPTKAST